MISERKVRRFVATLQYHDFGICHNRAVPRLFSPPKVTALTIIGPKTFVGTLQAPYLCSKCLRGDDICRNYSNPK